MMKYFVKDFCKTVQAGVVIFSMYDDNNILFYGIVNQPFHAYSFQHVSNFLSSHTLNKENFRQS